MEFYVRIKGKLTFLAILIFLMVLYKFTSKGDINMLVKEKREETGGRNKGQLIIDGHNDTMMKIVDEKTWLPKVDIGEDTDFHIDIPKLEKGGVNVPFFASYTRGYGHNFDKSNSRTLALINALYWTEERNYHNFQIVRSINELEQIVEKGKIAGILTIEGAYGLNRQNGIELIRQYYDLGAKMLAPTWNYSNELGEGAHQVYGDSSKTPSPKGLTDFGKEIITEMNRLGMIVDVSHLSEGSFWDVIETSKAPIVASHSGVASLKKHPRNLTDKQLLAIKENGGVVGLVLCAGFIADKEEVYITDYVDHIDYAVNLMGVDHVGIGSDFDGAKMPKDLEDASKFQKIVNELKARGYSKEDMDKILGLNFLRVFKEAEEEREVDKLEEISILITCQMGELINKKDQLPKARLMLDDGVKIDLNKSRAIIDGMVYPVLEEENTGYLYVDFKESLIEGFHTITYEVYEEGGSFGRETKIFYIDNN